MGVDLYELPTANFFNKEGALPAHPLNHWGTWNAVGGVLSITEEFNRTTGITPHVNDLSLPWGGRYDIGPPKGAWWGPPHHEHIWGTNADIPYSKLDPHKETFRLIAEWYGGNPHPSCLVKAEPNDIPTCWHLRFAN